MTAEGWRELVLEAVKQPESLNLLAKLLEEQDAAKQRLRDLGFGVIGRPWLDVVEEIARFTHERS